MSCGLHLPILGRHQTLTPLIQDVALSGHLLPFKEVVGETSQDIFTSTLLQDVPHCNHHSLFKYIEAYHLRDCRCMM